MQWKPFLGSKLKVNSQGIEPVTLGCEKSNLIKHNLAFRDLPNLGGLERLPTTNPSLHDHRRRNFGPASAPHLRLSVLMLPQLLTYIG